MQYAVPSADLLKRVALIGSYIPRRCGIATFTSDLLEALATASPNLDIWAVAMDDRPEGYRYPHRVKFEINERRIADYRLAADFLNASRVDVLCLQHEYGIFGGEDGDHILSLLKQVRMPVVTTLHTVLREPTENQRRILTRIGQMSDKLVVMAEKACEFLRDIYNIPHDKIVHIPHGIPDVPFIDPNFYKDQFAVEGKKVILTFGLLGPGKGIENMIDAMPKVVEHHPDAVYIVLGATHPHVQATYGEDYRTALQRRAEELGVGDHVIFHNRYVEINELCEYLCAADVYVTPYLSEAQIVSGTLAYALGAGNAVISTPYWYAQELLADGRGRIVPFADPHTLGVTVSKVFDDDNSRHAMRKQGYMHTRDFVWSKVAQQYLDVFRQCEEPRGDFSRSASAPRRSVVEKPELPEIKLDHLIFMTDTTSVLRHAVGEVPDLAHGYSLDDTARALIAALKARDHMPGGAGCSALIKRYLAFINFAFNREELRFRNLLGFDRNWLEEVGSEESHGRAIWALGEMVARAERKGHSALAVQLFHQALPTTLSFTSPLAWAFTLIGCHAYLRQYNGDTEVKRYRGKLAKKLADLCRKNSTPDWHWPLPVVNGESGYIPHALLLSGQWMFEPQLSEYGLRILHWLDQIQTGKDGIFVPIGNDGGYTRKSVKSHFNQVPIDVQAMIDAMLEAYRMTEDRNYLKRAYRIFNWFLGDNEMRLPLYDPTTGGCSDGLHSRGINQNQGAEATVAWLLALTSLYDLGEDLPDRDKYRSQYTDNVVIVKREPDAPTTAKDGKTPKDAIPAASTVTPLP